MPNKSIIMYKLRLLLRLYFQESSGRYASQVSGLSRTTVRLYWKRIRDINWSEQQWKSLSNIEVNRILVQANTSERTDARHLILKALLPEICKALRRPHMSALKQWHSYIEVHPDGYCKTQFFFYIRQYRQRHTGYMVLHHKAGDKMMVDYTGQKISYVDRSTGECIECEVFVAILPCSQYTYAEAQRSQKQEDFIDGCQNAFHYFGGVTKAIVPDNLKSAVITPSRYEPKLNDAFNAFAEHYQSAILPARVRKPRDKALVEGAVRIIYQRVFNQVEDKEPSSIEELNLFIAEAMDDYNEHPLNQGASRLDGFESEERSYLQELPEQRYEPLDVALAKVMKNGHVRLSKDKHYYSVPYTLIGKKVKLLFTIEKVNIYYNLNLVASHTRSFKKSAYSTDKEHLASHHKALLEWNPAYFIEKARHIGPNMRKCIERILKSKNHPEAGYKSCSGVLSLAKRYGRQNAELACGYADTLEVINYHVLVNILERKLYLDIEPEPSKIVIHQNLRGGAYYASTKNTSESNNPQISK